MKAWRGEVLFLGPLLTAASVLAQSPADLEFFENEVRPLLVASCSECHGDKEQWSELRLDARAAILKGGERGPAIVPGKPNESLLIQAVRRSGELEMPPDEKLTAAQIAILEHWVEIGAPWPANDSLAADQRAAAQQAHWAFQPVRLPTCRRSRTPLR